MRYLPLFFAAALCAQPTPTLISDTIHTAAGLFFSGRAVVSWPAFTAVEGSQIARGSMTVPLYNGKINMRLVPTTSALTPAVYSVVFTNAAGLEQFSETWDVPASGTPLTIAQIKVVPSAVPAREIHFADQTPAGTVDGANAEFTLSARPNPPASLQLFRNGLLMRRSVDYTLSGALITFVAASVPVPGDILAAWFTRRL